MSATTNDAVATTTLPSAPTNVSARATSRKSIQITWTDTSSNEQGFVLEVLVRGKWQTLVTLPAGTTSYTHNGLKPRSSYTYRVAAYNQAGQSSFATMTTSVRT
jgi:hypothetical protein